MNSRPMSNIDKRALAMTKELATLMVERFSMNPVSSKLLNEAWQKEFPDEVAIAKRMLALLDELETAEKRIAGLEARDKPKFVQCWSCKHDIEVLAIADCDGYCPRCAAPIDLDDEPYAAAGKGA